MARAISTTALWALAALRDEERNAYQVWRYLQTKGIELTTPGAFNILRSLMADGLVETYQGFDARNTHIYRLTEKGKMRAAVESENLRFLMQELSA